MQLAYYATFRNGMRIKMQYRLNDYFVPTKCDGDHVELHQILKIVFIFQLGATTTSYGNESRYFNLW